MFVPNAVFGGFSINPFPRFPLLIFQIFNKFSQIHPNMIKEENWNRMNIRYRQNRSYPSFVSLNALGY